MGERQEIEMIVEMLILQDALDKFICEKKNIEYSRTNTNIKLIEEVGELLKTREDLYKNHKSKPYVNRKEELKELVDCWHYVLSLNNYFMNKNQLPEECFPFASYIRDSKVEKNIELAKKKYVRDGDNEEYFEQVLCDVIIEHEIADIIQLSFLLGYGITDIYNAYIEKNKENYERQHSGY